MSETEDSEDIFIMDNQTTCDWSRQQTLALITELKKYSCLYSKLDKDYSNLTQKNKKLNLMVEKLKEIKPDVTLICIQREIATLQRQMLAETTKKKNLGNLYQPKLWCYDKLFFLADNKLTTVSEKFINTTKSQFQIMVDFMIQHKDSDEENERVPSGDVKVISNELWQTLTDKLNADGIPNRSPDEWKKVWSYYKYRLITKVREYIKNKTTTGGGPSKTEYFTALEQAVIDLLNLKVDLSEDTDSKLILVPKKFPHTTISQFEIMVDFMIQHKGLAEETGRAPSRDVKVISTQLWQTLTDKLNADSIPNRSLYEWKKVWSNYKTQLKRKVHQYNKNIITTGGGPSKTEYFTAPEQAVIDLLNLKVDLNEDADSKLTSVSKKLTKSQLQIMVDLMIQHKDLDGKNRRARIGYVRATSKKLWQTLTDKLNADGIPKRSLIEWKKMWSYYKYRLIKKVRQYKKDKITTGGGPSKTEYFAAQEQAVIDLLNLKIDLNEDADSKLTSVSRKFKHTTKSQLQIMMEFMIQHEDLAKENRRARIGYVRATSKKLWQTLTDKLNADGNSNRSLGAWKTVWSYYKCHLIKKVRQYNENEITTDGGPSEAEYFTSLEQAVIDLLNLKVDLSEDFKRTTKSQLQIMVDFMIQHKDLAETNGQVPSDDVKAIADQLWRTLTDKLNANSIRKQSPGQWKRVWSNYKSNLKRKVRQYQKNKITTGGGPSKTEYFTAPEQTVIDLLNLKVDADTSLRNSCGAFSPALIVQIEIIVDFMIQHKEFACENAYERDVKAKRIAHQLWQNVTDKLNTVGPNRSLDEWRAWWSNYKFKLKKKIRQYNTNMKKTGDGPSKTEHFTPPELDVIDLFNYNVTLNKDVMSDSDKELLDKYILLETIVHEWTQRCQKYNFSLTDYAVRRKALVLANIIEMKDFDASPEWITNFKKKFKIECASETTEVIISASKALRTVRIYDVAFELRFQNKFPEHVNKIYDEKFKHKDSIGEDQPAKKKRKLEPNLIDLTEACAEDAEILSTNSDSQIIRNIEFQRSKSQDSINDINVTTRPLTKANPSASSHIQLNKKSAIKKILPVSTILQNSESSVNNNMNLEEEDVVSIQSQEDVPLIQNLYDKELIISEKNSEESSKNARVLCAEEDIEDLLTNYTITLENIPKSSISSENERVPLMDTTENCGDTQLDTNCEDTNLINCKDEVLAADIHEDKFTRNKSEKLIENQNQNVSINDKFPPIQNYEDALIQLKILEDFALIKCNFRAINFITNLEHVYKNKLKNKCRFS